MPSKTATAELTTPLAVSPERAGALLGFCRAYVYQLLNQGELVSYRSGRARRIPFDSIKEFQARKLAEEARP